jgi:hypothetical protein
MYNALNFKVSARSILSKLSKYDGWEGCMAIYHCAVQRIKRSNGRGIIAAAAYRSGQKLLEEKTQTVYDYRHKTKIIHAEIVAPLCAPDWVYDREVLWNTVDKVERRKDARLARELLVALPFELSERHYIDLVRRFVFKNFVKEGMIADYAIHAPSSKKGGLNFHAHILLSLRSINTEGFGNKVRQWDHVSYLYQWRESWAEETNRILELEGFECRIDHRSRATKEYELAQELEMKSQKIEMEQRLISCEQDNDAEATEDLTKEELQGIDAIDVSQVWHDASLDEVDEQHAIAVAQQLGSTEWLDPQHNLKIIQEHRSAYKELLSTKNGPELLLEDRIEALELLASGIKARLEKIETLYQRLPDGKTKEWLTAFYRLENAVFKQYSHQIFADILEVKNANEFASEISNRRYLADVWRRKHSECLSEWHFHSVIDKRYRPLTTKAAELIDQVRNQYQLKLNKLHSKALRENWKAAKLNEEITTFKQLMDSERKDLFELKKDIARERGLSR